MSVASYGGVNPLHLILNTIYYSNPVIFYIFIAAVILAVIITFFENVKAGLLAALILSAFFYAVGMFIPYIFVPMVLAFVLLLLDILGFASVGRSLENIRSWFYLSRRAKKSRK